ncbi:hypothetical protein CRV24_006142 [Beauveria bassiana]|nr:hypothetical protein CRV24_006142 [Beauveria bassiana]KAH8708870.1 Oxidase ustYa [Beauveria bassiana]
MTEKKPWYSNIPRKDTLLYSFVHQDDSFDSEASSSRIEDEDSPTTPGRMTLTINIYHTAFFLVVWTLFIFAVTWATVDGASIESHPHHHDHHNLMKSPVPTLPKEVRVFEFNQTFVDPPNPQNDQAWNDLLPFGRGYVFVKNGTKYGLHPGIETKYGEIYSVALYHQLHCLGLVRRNYWRLMNGVLAKDVSVIDEAHRQQLNSHTGHCFDYFRQSFECAADMSLEWPRTEADGSRFQVDGKGIPHVCTSKVALTDYMQAYGYNASRNHDIAA